MSRRISANMSKKKALEDRNQKEIDSIRRDFCTHCQEPAVGPDKCDKCEYGQRLGDLYWMQRMMDPEYGS